MARKGITILHRPIVVWSSSSVWTSPVKADSVEEAMEPSTPRYERLHG